MLTDDTGSAKYNSIKMLGAFMKLIIQNVKISNLLNIMLNGHQEPLLGWVKNLLSFSDAPKDINSFHLTVSLSLNSLNLNIKELLKKDT